MRSLAASLAVFACVSVAKAIPFASCITNSGNNVSFLLNEGGATVTVKYGDGSTDANFNGTTTGTNLASGAQSFTVPGTNTTYSIVVTKNGLGAVSTVQTNSASGSGRGLACNWDATSPYFGRAYLVQNSASTPIMVLNSDLTTNKNFSSGGVTWGGPYRVSVGPPGDDSVYVSDLNYVGGNNVNNFLKSAVWKLDPNISGVSPQLFLGPVGATAGVHNSALSEIQIQGTAPNQIFYIADGDFTAQPESILAYNFGSSANLPWETAPNVVGPQFTPVGGEGGLGNVYAQMTQSTVTNLLYISNQRNNLACADLSIYAPPTTGTPSNLVWNSYIPTGSGPATATGDYFVNAGNGGSTTLGGLVGSAVSPDGRYFVGMGIDNHLTIVSLTNGVPDVSTIYYVTPPSFGQNGRGIAWDAADNILVASSGSGKVWEFSLGLTATATTTGNLTSPTGFTLTLPSTQVSVTASTPAASQGGVNGTVGTPVPGVFTFTRTDPAGYANPLTVNFTLSGTATNGVYTTTPSAGIVVDGQGTIVIPATQQSVTLSITPATANVPRLTTTIIATVNGGAYNVTAPFIATVFITNTSSQELLIAGPAANSMYKAFSNDYGSFTIERLGDLTIGPYTVAGYTSGGGTAVAGTDYTAPTTPTFNAGDITHVVTVQPLVGGLPPVDSSTAVYTGNKTAIIGLASGGGTYTAGTPTASVTIIDNADPVATVLYSDPLDITTAAADTANWTVAYANADMATHSATDYDVEFGYDLTANNPNYGFNGNAYGIVSLPPNGATNCLRVTVNKNSPGAGATAGVSIYPPIASASFSGNYAVRFNMCLVQGSALNTATEGAMFGINHNGSDGIGYLTNWWVGDAIVSEGTYTNWSSDGIWYWVTSDAGGAGNGDFIEFTGAAANSPTPNTGWQFLSTGTFGSVTFPNVYKNQAVGPLGYTNMVPGLGAYSTDSAAGVPAAQSSNTGAPSPFPLNTPEAPWSDVEIKQINSVVTMSINKIPVFVYTNTTTFTNGTFMLGYDDPFKSVGSFDGAAYFSNIRVVRIAAPVITSITANGTTVTITFTTTDADNVASDFTLLSSGTSTIGHVDTAVAGATFTQLPDSAPGVATWKVTTTQPASHSQLYRIMLGAEGF